VAAGGGGLGWLGIRVGMEIQTEQQSEALNSTPAPPLISLAEGRVATVAQFLR